MTKPSMAPARQKLLDAALNLIRMKGYAATAVDELCACAGVAKGSFFHHFENKEALAIAAANYWSETTGAFFTAAPYHKHKNPLDRVLGYIDFRRSILAGEVAEFIQCTPLLHHHGAMQELGAGEPLHQRGVLDRFLKPETSPAKFCLVGTMVQEVYNSHPAIRAACDASISEHAAKVEADIAEAMKLYGIRAKWTARSLALHTQAVFQGAFILAKAKGGTDIAISSVDHLRRYVELLFQSAHKARKAS